jgi:hypothetical protein
VRQSDAFRAHRVEVVNHLEVASRWLVGRYGTGRQVVLLGSDALARQLTLEVARFWRTVRPSDAVALPVTLVAPDADAVVSALKRQIPSLGRIVQLKALVCADERLAPSLVEKEVRDATERVVVAVVFADEGRAADAALQLREDITSPSVVIVTRLDRLDTGLGRLLAATPIERFAPNVAGVDPGQFFEWRQELLARVLHTDYLRRQRTDAPSTSSPSDLPQWDELHEDQKAQDRERAHLLLRRLEAFGYAVEGSLDWNLKSISLADRELESLAKDEHDRWRTLKKKQGWERGARKDTVGKLHPDLVVWDELSEQSREYNLSVARDLPGALASLGVLVEQHATQ